MSGRMDEKEQLAEGGQHRKKRSLVGLGITCILVVLASTEVKTATEGKRANTQGFP